MTTSPVPEERRIEDKTPFRETGVEIGSQLRRDWVVILLMLAMLITLFHNQGVTSRRADALQLAVTEALARQEQRDQSVSLLRAENKTMNDRLLGFDIRIAAIEGSVGEVKSMLHEAAPKPVETENASPERSSDEPLATDR